MSSLVTSGASIERFREIYNAVDRIYDLYARSCGLSPTEFWCVASIAAGRSSQAEVAEELAASRQTVNSAFKALIRQGLIELEPHPQNGRVKQARLTLAGEAFVADHLRTLDEAEEAVWNAIPKTDRQTLNDVMDRFYQGFAPAIDALTQSQATASRKE